MSLVYLAIILACASLISTGNPRKCDELQTKADFNIDKYHGLWYEVATTGLIIPLNSVCSTFRYTTLANGTIEMKNSQCVYENKISIFGNVREQETGSAQYGKFNMSMPAVGPTTIAHWVLDTDYTGYSIVVSCLDYDNGSGKNITGWIFSRKPFLTDEQKDKIHDILVSNNVPEYYFRPTFHENCCYDPTSDSNNPITVSVNVQVTISTP